MVGSDIFDWKKKHYLLTVDYYSKYIEVEKLHNMSASNGCCRVMLQKQLCRHGLPETIRTDNGPQHASKEFSDFCKSNDIIHVTSSPHYPQSNGEAERAVKQPWAKATDKQMALLQYHSTPVKSCGLSPAQLLMSRQLRDQVPPVRSNLLPQTPGPSAVKVKLDSAKQKLKVNYDNRAAKELPLLKPGDRVRIQAAIRFKEWLKAKVIEKLDKLHTYLVEHHGQVYRRNRKHIRSSSHHTTDPAVTRQSEDVPDVETGLKTPKECVTQSGRTLSHHQDLTTTNQCSLSCWYWILGYRPRLGI